MRLLHLPLRRRVIATLAVSALSFGFIGTALADGDPASDILIAEDVFVPFPAPPKPATASLKAAVAKAFAHKFRIKVAVIGRKTDLGSIPSLFNKPQAYAKFLGTELSSFYVGPLLIVMPAGFGIYDGGSSSAAENRVLRGVHLTGKSAEALTRSAAAAVTKLTAAKALRSKDAHAPTVFPRTAFARSGQTAKLEYIVLEDSERTKEVVRVFVGTEQTKVFSTKLRTARYSTPHSVSWLVPSDAASASMKYCVVATDGSGNSSASACAAIKLSP
jgi:hypothetical protein